MLLQTKNITKLFGGNKALDNVNISFEAGTVHSLVGENGAGKSTLIKILTGVYQPTSGQVVWEGKNVQIERPKDAQDLGVNVIHQDRQLVPYFTGLENLFLNRKYPKNKFGGIDWRKMREQADALKEKWKIDVPLHKPVYEMTATERTMLEILRAMSKKSKVLILDEPTASLTDRESEILFTLIENLRKENVCIIYISHRLEEVIKISDCVTVLTGGRVTASLTKDEITKEKIIYHMTDGQQLAIGEKGNKERSETVLLSVDQLATKDEKVKNVSFQVHAGEIVGMYGLAGAGRTESMEAIFGLREPASGEVKFQDRPLKSRTPKKMIEQGIVLIPENRHEEGLIMSGTIRHNMTLPILHEVTKGKFILNNRLEAEKVSQEMKRFKVKAVGQDQTVSELSGGNQQKVVFGKALLTNPKLYICDEPTQAVDIMTRNEIHLFLRNQASEGKGIIFISSDIQEILEISDRIIVFSEGETVAELENENIDTQTILNICYKYQKEN